ncbi:hypothetical protein [Alteromonas sp. 5E99-2]|uniref:hypothetical protein n=1 Tax=Alteromonas sp. 5E99-2 TaxID=2817683 RepID=UPI001A9A1A5D|nr:hypothetical protein [Alteromonas sp. 5E99-2]
MEYNFMYELSLNEIQEVNGGKFSWSGLAGATAGGAVVGGAFGSLVGGVGFGPGLLAGGLSGGGGYLVNELIQYALDDQ